MDWDREELERAIQESDRLQAEFEQHQRQRTQRQERSIPAGVNREEWLSRPRPAAKPLQQPQQQSAGMDKATSDAFNKWLTDYVGKAIGANNKALVEALGEDIVEFVCEYVHKHLGAETKKLREEIGSLRADMNVQTGIARGAISELKGSVSIKRKQRDVA